MIIYLNSGLSRRQRNLPTKHGFEVEIVEPLHHNTDNIWQRSVHSVTAGVFKVFNISIKMSRVLE